jgi:hypothetical protein
LQPSEASVLIRRADAQDASEVAGVLRQSFLEYQDQYTREGFATPFLAGAIRLYERFGFKRTPGGPNDLFGTPLFSMAKALNGKKDFEQVTRKENLCRRTTDTPPAFA